MKRAASLQNVVCQRRNVKDVNHACRWQDGSLDFIVHCMLSKGVRIAILVVLEPQPPETTRLSDSKQK